MFVFSISFVSGSEIYIYSRKSIMNENPVAHT